MVANELISRIEFAGDVVIMAKASQGRTRLSDRGPGRGFSVSRSDRVRPSCASGGTRDWLWIGAGTEKGWTVDGRGYVEDGELTARDDAGRV